MSNFTISDLEKPAKSGLTIPAVNQVYPLLLPSLSTPLNNASIRLHPYNYTQNKPLLEYHARHGIVTEAYGSLAYVHPFLSHCLSVSPPSPFPSFSHALSSDRPITTYPNGPVDVPLKAVASRLGITPTQVIFAWVKAKGAVIVTFVTSLPFICMVSMNA